MPLASATAFESITMYLSVLRYMFKSNSEQGKYDLNKRAENFFRDFLNLAFDYNLINLNDVTANHAAIDLGDTGLRLCFQVTVTNSSTKIIESLDKFIDHKLDQEYDRFVMLLLSEKKNYSKKFPVVGKDPFDPERDIWDVNTLLHKIDRLPLVKQQQLEQLLETEMRPLFAKFTEPGSIFASQPIVKLPCANAKRVLDELQYGLDDFDGQNVLAEISELYRILSKLSEQARTCLHVIVERGEDKLVGLQLAPQEFDNLISILPPEVRVGNFRILENAGLAYFDDENIIAKWSIDRKNVNFYALARDVLSEDDLRRLIVDANFEVLDSTPC